MERSRHIDFIKGLCILSVLIQHYAWQNGEVMRWRFSFWLGMAVPVFMMVSGYVTALSFQRKGVETLSAACAPAELLRRFLRYALPWLPVFLAEEWVLFHRGILPHIGPFVLLKDFLHGGEGPGSYYIPIAMQLVFVLPALYLLIRKKGFRGLVLCGVLNGVYELLHWAYGMGPALYRVLMLRYLLLAGFGCYLALYPHTLRPRCHVLSFLLGLGWLVLVEFLGYLPRVLTDWSVTSVLAALYIMPIFALAVEHGKLHFAPLDLLGKASYDIFLLQILYHSFWVEHIYALIPQRPLQLLVNILICCAVGIAFHFIETPITRKLQRWAVSLLKSA